MEDRKPEVWQIRTEGREGFEFGLDMVTPVSFQVVKSANFGGNALYAYRLPDPDTDAYHDWLLENRGRVVIASLQDIQTTISELRGDAPAKPTCRPRMV